MTKYLRNFKDKFKIKEAEDLQKAEILAERRRRYLLVVKARWGIMLSYTFFCLITVAWIYLKYPKVPIPTFFIFGLILAAASVAYNGFLHYSYERLSIFRGTAQIQMVVDILIVTALVHFTGGVNSWSWSIYLLVILQSAFLFDRKIETMEIAMLSGLSFGLLTIFENSGVLRNYALVFGLERYTSFPIFITLKVFWVIISSFAVAIIGTYMLGVIRQRERYLANKSITDGLTGLYNHSYFYKRLNSELERARRYKRKLSLILIDLDDFKGYNDSYGHQAGDKLLSSLASVFKQNIRSNDIDTVYRYGGDEFAIIAPETSSEEEPFKPAGAITMADRIRAKVKEQLPVTASIGISSFPHHANNVSTLFKAADFALYEAKEQGKDCVINSSKQLIIKRIKNGAVKN